MEKQTQQLFAVQGMSCQHCVAAVTRAVQLLDKAAEVEVDLAAGRVRVNSAAAEAELLRVLAEAGYPATAMQV